MIKGRDEAQVIEWIEHQRKALSLWLIGWDRGCWLWHNNNNIHDVGIRIHRSLKNAVPLYIKKGIFCSSSYLDYQRDSVPDNSFLDNFFCFHMPCQEFPKQSCSIYYVARIYIYIYIMRTKFDGRRTLLILQGLNMRQGSSMYWSNFFFQKFSLFDHQSSKRLAVFFLFVFLCVKSST